VHLETELQKEVRMNRFTSTLSLVLAFGLLGSVPVGLAADTSTTTTTEKTTTYKGVVSDINPSTSTIILKSETSPAPVTYTFTKETAFVDAQGNVVSYETIKNAPVTVEYIKEGDRTIVKRVVATRPGSVTHKEETTTHTETR
jgi:hypothetical protein